MKEQCTLHIMIVDDDRDCLDGLHFSLGLFGHKLKTISSPIKALEEFKKDSVDIVITDFLMPEMNGIEFILKLRKIDPTVKVILITAYGGLALVKRAVKNKIFNILSKPIDINKLFESIDYICYELKKEKQLKRKTKGNYTGKRDTDKMNINLIKETDNE